MREEGVKSGPFWTKVTKGPGCWLWKGYIGRSGYGQHGRKHFRAHRVSYALTYGPIPEGMNVLHRCDVRACVRPDHLFLGSHVDNVRDRDSKGRQKTPAGVANGSGRLTDSEVTAIRALRGKLLQREIADMFGTSQSHVSRIFLEKQRKADAA